MALGLRLGGKELFPWFLIMWNWISCYVTGHEYSVCCDHGRMFLRCLVCGRRSEGWLVNAQPAQPHVHDAHRA